MTSCHKKRYSSRSEAKKEMKLSNRLYKSGLTTPYLCPTCNNYHLTTMSKQSSRDYTRFLKKNK